MEKFYRKGSGGRAGSGGLPLTPWAEFPALLSTSVGYMGGDADKPTYKQVCTGATGHAEVLHVEYDPATTSYEALVRFFFRLHDPTTLNRQANDRGTQYRSAIFYYSPEQKEVAERVRNEVQNDAAKVEPVSADESVQLTGLRADGQV